MGRRNRVRAGLFIIFLVAYPATAEHHYGDPHKNCQVDAAVPLPLARHSMVKGRPAWAGWQMFSGGVSIAARGNALTRLDPASGAEVELMAGLTFDRQVQAAAGPASVYVLTAPANNAQQPAKIELTAYATGTYARRWSVEPFSDVFMPLLAAPVASAELVFAGVANRIGALDSATGRAVWSRTLQALVGCCPALEGGAVVLPTTHGLEALSLIDGRTLWNRPADPSAFDPARGPTVADGKIYFTFDARTISALDLRTGSVLWTSPPLPLAVDTRHPPIADAHGVFVPLDNGLARISSEGSVVWVKTYPFLKMRAAKPAILAASNAVFLGGSDGLHAVSLVTGEEMWSEAGLGQVVDVEFIPPGIVAVNSQGEIFALAPPQP